MISIVLIERLICLNIFKHFGTVEYNEVIMLAKKKRWGKKFIDTRNWPVYNEQLVRRGEYWIELDFVRRWDKELAEMNEGKIGAPYQFPKSLIKLQALWHAKQHPYRIIEGMTRKLVEVANLPAFNDYTTSNRRINKLHMKFQVPKGDHIVVFSDGTGLQAVSGGEYLREKYGKKNRTWVQVILVGDAKSHEPVSVEAHIIKESEPESAERQIARLIKSGVPIVAAGGDGGLDDKGFYNFCDDHELKPIIKPDKNARDDTECEPRNKVVKERDKLGYTKWARKNGYGHRWPATEGIFGATKNIFGEELKATSEQGLMQEAISKFWAYQRIKRYGETKA